MPTICQGVAWAAPLSDDETSTSYLYLLKVSCLSGENYNFLLTTDRGPCCSVGTIIVYILPSRGVVCEVAFPCEK